MQIGTTSNSLKHEELQYFIKVKEFIFVLPPLPPIEYQAEGWNSMICSLKYRKKLRVKALITWPMNSSSVKQCPFLRVHEHFTKHGNRCYMVCSDLVPRCPLQKTGKSTILSKPEARLNAAHTMIHTI